MKRINMTKKMKHQIHLSCAFNAEAKETKKKYQHGLITQWGAVYEIMNSRFIKNVRDLKQFENITVSQIVEQIEDFLFYAEPKMGDIGNPYFTMEEFRFSFILCDAQAKTDPDLMYLVKQDFDTGYYHFENKKGDTAIFEYDRGRTCELGQLRINRK